MAAVPPPPPLPPPLPPRRHRRHCRNCHAAVTVASAPHRQSRLAWRRSANVWPASAFWTTTRWRWRLRWSAARRRVGLGWHVTASRGGVVPPACVRVYWEA
eukprot:47406-Chlamydomonas_euryale.AAC.1